MTTYIISRYAGETTLNGKEYLLTKDGKLLAFTSREQATLFLTQNGIHPDNVNIEERKDEYVSG